MSSGLELYSCYESWKGWSRLFEYTAEKADYFRGETAALAIRGADVLEIGFGSGDLLQWMVDQGGRVSGSEINPVLIQAATDRGIPIIDSEIECVSEKYESAFDTIIALDVFEHLTMPQIEARLEAIERMLRSGGHLLLRFPNAQSPFGLAPQCGDPTHLSFLSKSVFESLLARRSMVIVGYGHEYRAKGRRLRSRFVRRARSICRDLISIILNAVYSTDIPYDPVVVIRIKKLCCDSMR